MAKTCKQVVGGEWLDQVADDAGAERVPSYTVVRVGGDEDDWDVAARGNQPLVQL